MSSKHSPGKVTLAMIKGKPITTSVPVIHYHASDDELEEIYPSTDEEKRLSPEFEKILSKITSSPQKCTEKRSTQESCGSENNSDCQSVTAENLIPEGTPPSLGAWKMLSEIKGKITKTFEEKLSEIKSDKKKLSHSRAESSSISDSEDQGSVTPCNNTMASDKQINESSTPVVLPRNNPGKYVGFSGIKTGLKDKSLQEECVESGIEASEFSPDIGDDLDPCAETNASFAKSLDSDSCINSRKQVSQAHSTLLLTRRNLNLIFSHLLKQLTYQITYTSVAVFIAILCIYYVTPLPEYLIGLVTGVVTTIMFYNMSARFKTILTSLPNEKFVSRQVIPVLEIPAVEEHAVIERFQGWMNELPYCYEPTNYHVARTKSVFLKLEGNVLRIMETRMKIPKKAVWDESQHKLKFFRKRVYNLNGAKIELLPCGLARRRRWSKKYPICITLKKRALICNVILKGSAYDECYSTINGHEQPMSESSTKGIATPIEAKNQDETWQKEEENGGDKEKSLLEKEEDAAEYDDDDDDDDIEHFNSDFDNDEFDNEYREGELQTLEAENPEEVCRKGKRIRRRGNTKKYHMYEFDYIDRRKTTTINNHDDSNHNRGHNYNDEDDGVDDDDDYYVDDYVDDGEDEDEDEDDEDDDEDEEEDDEDDDDDEDDEDEDDDDNEDDDYNKDSDDNEEKEDEDEDEGNEMLKDKKKVRQAQKYEVEKATEDEEMRKRKWRRRKRRKRRNREKGEEKADKKKEGEIEDEDLEDEARQAKGKEIEREEKEVWETVGMSQTAPSKKKRLKKRRNNRRLRNQTKIFIFARADREKEDWYRRLVSASMRCTKKKDASSFTISDASSTSNMLSTQRAATTETKLTNSPFESVPDLNYHTYMAKYLDISSSTSENEHSSHIDNTLWINCLIARILFDVHKYPETVNLIQDKIQRKLSSIKLPYFMECLLVSEVAVGQGAPIIRNVTKPVTNERGLWLDLDITYKGSLTMTVETKLNLMKLTKTGTIANSGGGAVESGGGDVTVCPGREKPVTKSPMFDSDMEDTPETSTEDDDSSQFCSPAREINPPTQSSGRKFLNIVDRIAANKYFRHATELSYVRRAMEGVSNTEIRLMVTVSSIEGCLSLNIPPAPSDRLWYGFKPVPKISLTVKPAVGERAVNIVYVTKWIEDKLLREFEKLVVLPNMDDFVLPLCPNYPYSNKR